MLKEQKRKRGRPLGRIYPEKGAPIQARVTEETMTRLRIRARRNKTRLSDQLRDAIKMLLASDG